MKFKYGYYSSIYIFLLFGSIATAKDSGGITIGGTRVIFDANKKESSLSITNTDSNPYLIQSWIESDNEDKEITPFIITPPLFKIEENQKNVLRIIYNGEELDNNKESLYWINIKSIPSTSNSEGKNTLQIAVKSKIKLIYRPANINGKPEDFAEKLIWDISGDNLTVKNPTPFIMNFYKITIGGQEVKNTSYVLPMTNKTFKINNNGVITWQIISDHGGVGKTHRFIKNK